MNLRQFKYFVGVVEAGNMTRAAEQLHVAQTALSMQMRQLEEDLGVPLLVRHSRGIQATDAGKPLHAREAVRMGITPALMLSIGPIRSSACATTSCRWR